MNQLSVEMYEQILTHLVSDASLDDNFQERATPFNETLLPFPRARTELARAVAAVSPGFYDLATPIVWQYLVVNTDKDLDDLLKLTDGGLFREARQPVGNYTVRIDFKSWRRVDMEKSIQLLSRLPNVQVLSIECRHHPGPLWRHPLNEEFYRGLPSMCPKLRRLQLLDAREAPTLEEVAFISRQCLELRSLHVAHLSEPYHRFMGPDAEDDTEDDEVSTADGDFWSTEQAGDSSSSGEGSDHGSQTATDSESTDEHDSEEEEEEGQYRALVSTRFPVALVKPSNEEEGDPLEFQFLQLKNLALGMGNIHGSISERRSMRKLLEAMEAHRPKMVHLENVNVYIPLDGIDYTIRSFCDVIKSCVLHMYYRAEPRAYVPLRNLTRLLVVVHTAYISIPLGLDRLQEFDILLRRPAFASNFTSPRVHHRMMMTAQALLDILLQDRYPSLRKIVMWKGTLAHNASIDSLAASRKSRFGLKGILLEVAGGRDMTVMRQPSPIQ